MLNLTNGTDFDLKRESKFRVFCLEAGYAISDAFMTQEINAGLETGLSRVESNRLRLLADDQLIVLHEVQKALAQDRGLPASLSLIADKARYLTSSASTALCLLDSDRLVLDFAAVAGRGAAEMVGQRVRVEDALPGQTAVSGEPLLAYNPIEPVAMGKSGLPMPLGSEGGSSIPHLMHDESFILSGGVRSAAVVPIVVGSVSVGSLAAINRLDGQSFTGSDLLMLQILASSASIAIQKDYLGRQAGQRERERNILFRVAQNTASSLDVQKILDGVLETLAKSVDLTAVIVFLLNDERTHLYIAAEHGLTEEEREIQILADSKLATAALSGVGRAFVMSDPESDPRYDGFLPNERAQQMMSMMVVPLAARDNPTGLIVVMSRQYNAYSTDDLTLLAAVSAQTAVAIENASLYEDATRRAEEATAIYELSQAVNTNLSLKRVLNFVADSILALLQVDKFALFLYNPQLKCLEIKVARNIRRDTVQSMAPSAEKRGIAWWVYEYETPAAVQDVAADHRNRSCPIDQEGVASLVSVPLQAGDDVIGVIHAMSSRRRSFTVAEMELLYTIANQVGVAVSNIQILEDTKQKSAALRRSFRRVAQALGVTADRQQTAQTIVDLAAEMMEVEKTVLYVVSGGSAEQLSIRAAHGLRLPPAAQRVVATTAAKETSAAWVARRKRSLAIENVAHDSRFSPATLLAPYVSRSGAYLAVPLKIGKDVVGVLETYARDARSFPADEMRQFLAFAAQAAVALQNSLLVEDADRRQSDLEAVARITELLQTPTYPTSLVECVRLLLETLQADSALIRGPKLRLKRKGLFVTPRDSSVEDLNSPARETLREALDPLEDKAGAILIWPTGEADSWRWKNDSRPLIAVSLAESKVVGSLGVARAPGRPAFDHNDIRLVQTVARLIGMAL